MTWGTIEATPVTLRTAGGDQSIGPFRVKESGKREVLAHKMARKAKRSLAASVTGAGRGLATTSGGSGAGGSMRRTALEASVRSSRGREGDLPGSTTPGGSGSTPRRSTTDLSPAARTLLGRTKPGKALESSLGQSRQWNDDEERRRVERARSRAREVESRDRLRRERWTVSQTRSLEPTRARCVSPIAAPASGMRDISDRSRTDRLGPIALTGGLTRVRPRFVGNRDAAAGAAASLKATPLAPLLAFLSGVSHVVVNLCTALVTVLTREGAKLALF